MSNRSIHQAVMDNNIKKLKQTLKNGGDVDQLAKGSTPLHKAVQENFKIEVVKILLKNGADLHAKDSSENTPLNLACEKENNVEIIKLLLMYEANINALNRRDSTPLHNAAKLEKNHEVVKLLIEHGAEVNAWDLLNNTPLHWAALKENNFQTVQILLEKGAEVNAQDLEGFTPLHHAVKVQHNFDTISLLLEYGANIHAKDGLGSSVFEHAVRIKNDFRIFKLLLEYGADLNEPDDDNSTPLHTACQEENNIDLIKFLIKNGADVNATTREEYYTPLHWATDRESNVEVVRLLLKHGAYVNARDIDNITPFLWAAKNSFEMVKVLLEHGADPSCSSEYIREMNLRSKSQSGLRPVELDIRNMVKVRMLNLMSEESFSTWKQLDAYQECNFDKFEEECRAEAEKLRKSFIFKTFTFSDILTKKLRIVTTYLSNNDVIKQVKGMKYDKVFPIYSEMLEERIKKAADLSDALSASYQSLKILLSDHRLPSGYLNETLSYLGDDDVNALSTTFQSLNVFS